MEGISSNAAKLIPQSSLHPSHEDRVLLQVTNPPGISELADTLGKNDNLCKKICTPLSKIVN